MDFHLLGPVTAHASGRRLDLGPPMHRLLLAILLDADRRPVTTDQLINHIWGPDPPDTVRDLLHGYASKLRARLTAAATEAVMPKHRSGYRIHTGRDSVDVHRFHDDLTAARKLLTTPTGGGGAAGDAAAAGLLRQALQHWAPSTGQPLGQEPLADLNGLWVDGYRHRLRNTYSLALSTCLETELRLGRHAELVPELQDLARADPADEAVTALLMIAYYRSGQQAQAMHAFHRTCYWLKHTLSASPGKNLILLYQRILRHDPALDAPYSQPAGVTMTTSPSTSRQHPEPLPPGPHAPNGDAATLGNILTFRRPAAPPTSKPDDPVQDDSPDPGRDTEECAEGGISEASRRPAPPPGQPATGPHIGTQWNITGTNATINNVSGDMHINDSRC